MGLWAGCGLARSFGGNLIGAIGRYALCASLRPSAEWMRLSAGLDIVRAEARIYLMKTGVGWPADPRLKPWGTRRTLLIMWGYMGRAFSPQILRGRVPGPAAQAGMSAGFQRLVRRLREQCVPAAKQARGGGGDGLRPTLYERAVKDGAPERWRWRIGRQKQIVSAGRTNNYGDSDSASQNDEGDGVTRGDVDGLRPTLHDHAVKDGAP
jgi:hypothetical protein